MNLPWTLFWSAVEFTFCSWFQVCKSLKKGWSLVLCLLFFFEREIDNDFLFCAFVLADCFGFLCWYGFFISPTTIDVKIEFVIMKSQCMKMTHELLEFRNKQIRTRILQIHLDKTSQLLKVVQPSSLAAAGASWASIFMCLVLAYRPNRRLSRAVQLDTNILKGWSCVFGTILLSCCHESYPYIVWLIKWDQGCSLTWRKH